VQGKHYARTPTLGSAARRHSLLRTWCNSCRHIVDIDPVEQAARYGEDLPVSEWRARFGCPQCGSRVIDSVIGPIRPG
jgi:hypothetical protein